MKFNDNQSRVDLTCDKVPEWLMGWTANPMGFTRACSNHVLVGPFLPLIQYIFADTTEKQMHEKEKKLYILQNYHNIKHGRHLFHLFASFYNSLVIMISRLKAWILF